MQVFFGRISENSSNKNQLSKGFYEAKRGSSYFAELNDIEDFKSEPIYVFMISSNLIELWKASHWGSNGNRLYFEKTYVDLDGLDRAWFPALKFFYLDQDLIVFTNRRPNRKAFFKIKISDDFTEQALLDTATYSDLSNYRNIIVTNQLSPASSPNIHLVMTSSGIDCVQPLFSDSQLFMKFRDNTVNIGKGRYNKDGVLNKVLQSFNESKVWDPDELTLLNFYDAFLCEYYPSVDDVLNIDGDQDIYKISMGPGEIDDDTFTNLLNENLIIVYGNTGAKGRSHESQGVLFTEIMTRGDYFYLCRGNNACILVGQIISDAEPCQIPAYGDDGWYQRKFKLVKEAVIEDKYSGENKWWSPKNRSTCVVIPKNEYKLASTLLFAPHFSLTIQEAIYRPLLKRGYSYSSKMNSLNTILFGPPGTGKTYSTVDRALEALQIVKTETDSEEVQLELLPITEYEQRENRKRVFAEYQRKGRIYFCTFHQNMAYEDFVEGIKPVLPEEEDGQMQYAVVDGLFMRACVEATYSMLMQGEESGQHEIQGFLDFNALFDRLFDEVEAAGSMQLDTKTPGKKVHVSTTALGNFSIRHEGREKPYTVSRDRLAALFDKINDLKAISNINEAFRLVIGGCNSTAYWSVLNKIQALARQNDQISATPKLDKNLSYEQKRSIVRKYWSTRDARQMDASKLEQYVFIIDEINRGNVSQIFGELITLIEADKRIGMPEVIYADLPYSKQAFGIPPNLCIIGTMNTADRSVEALDTALRRRFSFVPLMSKPAVLKPTYDGIDLVALLETLNQRLRVLKDEDHTIGHAWFLNVSTYEELKQVFGTKVLPLLQEFFYNDYEKLCLLLGDRFFENGAEIKPAELFADSKFAADLKHQYNGYRSIRIRDWGTFSKEDFQSIYSKSPEK